jgi:predicted TIM-barrel fold metal-dependent hydrolase
MRPCPPPHPAPSRPHFALPPGACDAHCHVFGPAAAFPLSPGRAYTPRDQPKAALFALHDRLGVSRRVIVQASCHGTDNRALIDALAARPDTSRGVAALAADISDADLASLHAAGVRGARFNFMARIQKPPETAEIDAVIGRIAPLGWHLVLHFDPEYLPVLRPWIESLDLPVLIDHAARLGAADYPGAHLDSFCALMTRPHLWTKLSGVERGSLAGAPFDDMLPILQAVAEAAPDRVLWGTDWPHPVLGAPMPDDGALVDYLWRVIPESARRHAALVENPARLYGF